MFKVKDFMTKDVICTEKDTTISEIIDLMNQTRFIVFQLQKMASL